MARQVVRDIDHGWNRIKADAKAAKQMHVAIGILAQDDARDDGLSNVEIGTWQEYGTEDGHIPERSFLRAPIDAHVREYAKLGSALYGTVLAGMRDTREALDLWGLRVVADIRRWIQRGIPPPLSLVTIARKKSSKPLIDTGQLINSITHEVRSGRRAA
jgi:hypothetical protein